MLNTAGGVEGGEGGAGGLGGGERAGGGEGEIQAWSGSTTSVVASPTHKPNASLQFATAHWTHASDRPRMHCCRHELRVHCDRSPWHEAQDAE